MNAYFFAKALHIIGFVTWFAGLFYLVRLFIYHAESNERKPASERAILNAQYEIMERRLYGIITNPAMMITWIGGLSMLAIGYLSDAAPNHLTSGWLHVKLLFVIGLTWYHLYCKRLMIRLRNGENTLSSERLRGVNEVPTIILVAVVLLAVYKNLLDFGYAFAGLLAFGISLFVGIKVYKRNRQKAEARQESDLS